jgi:hypothetical protein
VSDQAARLADELREALDDPNRGDWGSYPWEHLGDAERDVRVLLAELTAARQETDTLERKTEQLREALLEARRTFDVLLEIGSENSLWRNVASVGSKDATDALAAAGDRQP